MHPGASTHTALGHVMARVGGYHRATGGGGGYDHDRTWSPAANAMWRPRHTMWGPCTAATRVLENAVSNAAVHCGTSLPMRLAVRYLWSLP